MTNTKKITLGIFGLGTVGTGVVNILLKKRNLLRRQSGIDFVVKTICVSDTKKKRRVDLKDIQLTDRADDILKDADIDQVIELVGGLSAAKTIVESALKNGKDVITANKALFAEKGKQLYAAATESGAHIGLEAAVCGGIPVIQGLKDGLVANRIRKVVGILNGTCNYILTEMRANKSSYSDCLSEAQAKGYAEQDPKMDVNGADTAHKLAILARLAFNREIDFKAIHTEGIEKINLTDIEFAQEAGYSIKLLAIAKKKSDEPMELRVHPTLVEKEKFLAHVDGVNNAVVMTGDEAGDVLFFGPGAGERPTASAVVSDIVAIARKSGSGIKAIHPEYKPADVKAMDEVRTRYYLRFQVIDKPGVMGALTEALGKHGISLASIHQRETTESNVPVIILTHEAHESDIKEAMTKITALDMVKGGCVMIRIGY